MIIVGAGETGARAAFGLRERGYRGRVVLTGDESHLPYERPPLSKGLLSDSAEPKYLAPADRYEAAGIELVLGQSVVSIDRQSKTIHLRDGFVYSYEKLLLAAGARPRPFPGLDADGKRVFYLRTYADALALHPWMAPGRTIAVVGGGFIGLELAAIARQAGANVTVVEALPRILMRGVPEVLAMRLQTRHVAEGVDIRCGTGISSIDSGPGGVVILMADAMQIEADIVVIGIGATPNTELAAGAGLQIENGILVDEYLCTSDPDILAAGDCCNFPLSIYGGRRVRLESWRSAQEQGILAAANMLGEASPVSGAPWFWSDQYDLTLQVAGLLDEAATTVERHQEDGGLILFHLAAGGRLVAASGLGIGNSVARDIRLAEMLIANMAHPDPVSLADPATKLKGLLKAA
ncbi:NAD(P)/FAD-dependent oxidoreductase [Rhizobium sp. LjRoot254]|uniref:NAD(P)/FAD-dependent oxidoreductase n=1 Tax=Rhizobium sp. LjRoot254 TaxID=3342297 RepID=UPI003ECF65EE